jgi:phage shock protein C
MKEGISRSRQNRVLGGVASGLADYLTIDPIIIRILFVVSVFFGGIGILLYLIMWIVIPEEKLFSETNTNSFDANDLNDTTINANINFENTSKSKNGGRVIFGIILIFVGLFFLGVEVFSFLNFEDLVPILLVGFGVYLVWNSKNSRG